MPSEPLDLQTAEAFTALACALCKQRGIDAQQLRHDFLDILEGIAKGPAGVGAVGIEAAALMQSLIESDGRIPPPAP